MTDISPAAAQGVNAKAYSVSELAFALKRTVEDAYGFVRLRGELSKVTFHGNGHVYLDLKDDKACISGVIWKTSVRSLAIRPQTGLEVIVTGKITTYPGRSQYQIIIETMEPAGIGALLAQLERLKAKLAAEGLFDAGRKRSLPSLPGVIGVITSPTGAVIRDILHRIADRWPCRVVVWPVVVQGEQSAAQVRAAIEGFDAISPGGPAPRPDLIIVARGGGSVEDLWPFNDEALARAVAACSIPLVSAVGHETDTTLIDFVSDRRAPTPTAPAELATPVFADLAGAIADYGLRMNRCGSRTIELGRVRLAAAGRLPRPQDLLALVTQRLDLASGRLGAALTANVAAHRHDLATKGAALKPRLLTGVVEVRSDRFQALARRLGSALAANVATHRNDLAARTASLRPGLLTGTIKVKSETHEALARRLEPLMRRMMDQAADRLANLDKLRLSLDPDRPLSRGFARVERADGHLVRSARMVKGGEDVRLVFHDGTRTAVIDGPAPPAPTSPRKAPTPPVPEQGRLF